MEIQTFQSPSQISKMMRRRRCWASHGFRRKTSSSSSATKNSKLSEQKHLVNWSPCKPNFMIHWDFGAQAHTSADDIFNSVVHRKWDGIRPWKRASRNPSSATLHLGLFYNNTELNAGGMAASTTATLRKSQLRSFAMRLQKADMEQLHIDVKSIEMEMFTFHSLPPNLTSFHSIQNVLLITTAFHASRLYPQKKQCSSNASSEGPSTWTILSSDFGLILNLH